MGVFWLYSLTQASQSAVAQGIDGTASLSELPPNQLAFSSRKAKETYADFLRESCQDRLLHAHKRSSQLSFKDAVKQTVTLTSLVVTSPV